MADSSTISAGLATLGVSGWAIATPGVLTQSLGSEPIKRAGAEVVYDQSIKAGERAIGATTGVDYQSAAAEWLAATVQTNATGDVTVYAGPCIVKSVRVRNASDAGVATVNTAGIILVKDGAATVKDGAALGKTAGSTIYDGSDGTQFRTSLVINFASALDNPVSSGKIEVLYRPMPAAVNW